MEGLFGGEGPQVQPVAVGEMHAFALACHQMISSPNPSITNVKVCRSEEHTSELQSLMRSSYDVFCLKTKTQDIKYKRQHHTPHSHQISHLYTLHSASYK